MASIHRTYSIIIKKCEGSVDERQLIGSPVSSRYEYEDFPAEITMDLRGFENKSEHIKIIKNCITDAIVIHYRSENPKRLMKIHIIAGDAKNEFLPLIHNQTRFFDISILPSEGSECRKTKFELRDEWVSQIIKNINYSVAPIRQELSDLKIENFDQLLFYRTVSDNPVQIRFKGYQIGKWNGKSKKERIVPVNNKSNNEGFADWADFIIKKRKYDDKSEGKENFYHVKEEHYLESILLEKLAMDRLEIEGRKIEKIFPASEVFFQFPVLLKRGSSSDRGNSSKYIDILAKSGNRPVVMELKVWNKKKHKNSRGQYLFSAFGQVLSYCNYLVEIFGNQKMRSEPELAELYNLDWHNPIICVVINEIDAGEKNKKDEIAIKFRTYIEQIKRHIINAELFFVEFEHKAWETERRFKVVNII
jgi:hypothetical protein